MTIDIQILRFIQFPLQIQIPLTSVISITKEKTAKFIPNAVAVSTEDETHTFTSLISRDATFKAMTKSWRKAIARLHLSNVVGIQHNKDDRNGNLVLKIIFFTRKMLKQNLLILLRFDFGNQSSFITFTFHFINKKI